MKAFWVQMIDLDHFSDISRDVVMAINFVEKNGNFPSFVALALRNEMGCHYLSVCIINSVNNASISCKHFVNFGLVTPELTELIVNFWYNMAKTGIFSRISQDIVDRFSQFFTMHMKALWVQIIDLVLVFRYVK